VFHHIHARLFAAAAALATSAFSAQAQTNTPATPSATLPPTIVTASELPTSDQVGPLEGFRALTSGSATRTPTPISEIPQSVSVIPRALIEAQGARTVDDALRNVPGVVPENPLFLNQNLNTFIRGFPAEIYRDGMQSFFDAGFGQSLLGIERIEVIRGPSGSLFGGGLGGGHGGVVNFISRLPGRENQGEIGFNYGPYGYANPYIDVNQVAGSAEPGGVQVAARLQAEYLRTRSYIENVLMSGYQVIPSVTARDDRTQLTLQAFSSERRADDYPGLPPSLTGNAAHISSIDRFRNANGVSTPRTVTRRDGARLLFEHEVDDVFTLRFAGQFASSNLEQPAQFQFGPAIVDTTFARFNGYLQQDLTQYTLLPSLQARFTTGDIRHTVLAGLENDRVQDNGGINFAFSDFFDFARPTDVPFVRPTPAPQTRNRYTTFAAFVQEQATIWERLHLLAAVRATDLSIKSETQAGPNYNSSESRVTPRLGVAFDVLPWLTPFAGWGQGIRSPSGYAFLLEQPKPETSEQWEAGIRVKVSPEFSASVAYFDIERRNAPVADPAIFGLARQTGVQRSRGAELETLWQPSRDVAFLVSYAYVDAEIVEDISLRPGTPLRAVPNNMGRVWASWRPRGFGPEWLDRVSLGGGATVSSGAPANDQNSIRTKGYAIFDAQIAYDTGPIRVALNARNIGDRQYTVPFGYFNNSVAPGAPAEVYLSVSYRF
jgi:iron complex outermembrane receptor protein